MAHADVPKRFHISLRRTYVRGRRRGRPTSPMDKDEAHVILETVSRNASVNGTEVLQAVSVKRPFGHIFKSCTVSATS